MTYFKHSSWKLSTPLPAAAAPTRPAPSACTAPCCPRLLFHGCWSSFSLLNCLSGQRFQLGGSVGSLLWGPEGRLVLCPSLSSPSRRRFGCWMWGRRVWGGHVLSKG